MYKMQSTSQTKLLFFVYLLLVGCTGDMSSYFSILQQNLSVGLWVLESARHPYNHFLKILSIKVSVLGRNLMSEQPCGEI